MKMNISAPLDKLTGSTQAQDVAASRGPSDVFQDCYRVKQYVKWGDAPLHTHPATWEFPQPFQVAAARTGLSWDVCNRVFLGQLAACNIDCDFCFRGATNDTVNVTPEEYVAAFAAYNAAFPDHQAGVMRISGGEPFLYQEWVAGVVSYAADDTYLWLDTNLTIAPTRALTADVLDEDPLLGVCGCFKPGLWDLDEQLANAKAIVEAGADCYFYWPSSDDLSVWQFEEFLGALEDAIPFAPLRLTVLNIKYNYSAVKEKNPDWEAKHTAAQANFSNRRSEWADFCAGRYPSWMCNAPSHEVHIG